jgi:TonB family protein
MRQAGPTEGRGSSRVARPTSKSGREGGSRRVRLAGVLLLPALLLAGCGGEDEIQQPVPLYGEDPIAYPVQLWDQGVEGETVLRIRVTETGRVDSVEVAESSGSHGLDSAAVAGARALGFQPGRKNGQRVPMWATVPVEFSTRPGEND